MVCEVVMNLAQKPVRAKRLGVLHSPMTEHRSAAMEVEDDGLREWAAFKLLAKKGGVFGFGSQRAS